MYGSYIPGKRPCGPNRNLCLSAHAWALTRDTMVYTHQHNWGKPKWTPHKWCLSRLSVYIIWKLDHIPSSCIVVMVHNMVKVVNIVHAQSTSYINAGASIAEMESETDSQPWKRQILMLQSQEMNSTVPYSFQTSGWSWHGMQHACYI